ncbi:Indoleamine 2,3-dioxygenase [Macrolepiota fuliginosa MF-IS2]|uniref:Indoleamine 2,3-dioxygenase n=1 Tax=Macrolepiota fuliginosa MF-IS2 TaxID=1400762 RepID=A0A9P5XNA1_9AGAR|nr:Indoleamine 2,3-dioxygenase [Macrolepiota fuliginosa MF-IS2]
MVLFQLLLSPPHAVGTLLDVVLSLYNSYFRSAPLLSLPDRRSLKDFDVDPHTGFFPPTPLRRLPPSFDLWEDGLALGAGHLCLGDDSSEEALSKRDYGQRWRDDINSWPTISVHELKDDLRLLQRAHYVLSWLVHLYVHSVPSSPTPPEVLVVPQSIAVPLVEVSELLQIAPVLTFADTVLWNYELINPDEPLSVTNIRFRYLFSGTEDEHNFYLSSAQAELVGVEMLRVFDEYYRLSPNAGDYAAVGKVSRDLIRLSGIINDIHEVIQSVRPGCDPHVFYWQVRPWWNGSGSDGPRWKYEGVPKDEKLLRSGPSAGQSAVMHALDIFLGVDHKSGADAKDRHTQFMEKMRQYMPGKHRDYLAYLSSSSRPIRELAKEESILRDPFNAAVAALQKLRTEHIKIACRYIVTMAHSQSNSGCPVASTWAHQQSGGPGRGNALGTGGNTVTTLLKHGRDATKRTALPGRT